jgi:hypothetical protein
MRWVYDDGGRADAGFRGDAGDCVARAIAIATGMAYREVYDDLADREAQLGRPRSARNGVSPKAYKPYLAELGAIWTPTMRIGSGTTVHLRESELPWEPWLIVRLSKHLVAVRQGVVFDTHDPTREGTRAVYGYWRVRWA